MSFAHPYLLVLLVLAPLAPILERGLRRRARVAMPTASWRGGATTWRLALRWLPGALRAAVLGLLVVCLARPQETKGWTTTSTEGVAIQIVFDRSGSMREPIAEGSSVSKNEVARQALIEFVKGNGRDLKGRTGDMVGLIAFARYADTISPLARAHEPLAEAAARIQPAENRAEDGTAIGDALALAASRLKRAEEEVARDAKRTGGKPEFAIKSKVIVLMTDGQNNAGETSPYDAASLAKQWGMRIYTIGVGAGERTVTINTPFGPQQMSRGDDVDERMLTELATSTGGSYFAAGTPTALADAYSAIDRLEKSRIDATEHSQKTELFVPLALGALGALLGELLLANTLFRRVA